MSSQSDVADQSTGMTASASQQHIDFVVDLFRRIDKNDNGCLEWGEFREYFRDGVMTSDELRDIFDDIDTGGNGTIENGELLAYFAENIGQLEPIFSSLSSMNVEITKALASTYSGIGSKVDARNNFFVRFFLKEICQALASLQSPLQAAIDSMTEAVRAQRPTVVPEQEIIRPAESSRKVLSGDAGNSAVSAQVDRLAALVDKLSGKVNHGSLNEAGPSAILVSFDMDVMADQIETFQNTFTSYLGVTQYVKGCLRSTASYNDENVCLYLVFESEEAFDAHLTTKQYRDFQRVCADTLVRPLKFATMATPAEWW